MTDLCYPDSTNGDDSQGSLRQREIWGDSQARENEIICGDIDFATKMLCRLVEGHIAIIMWLPGPRSGTRSDDVVFNLDELYDRMGAGDGAAALSQSTASWWSKKRYYNVIHKYILEVGLFRIELKKALSREGYHEAIQHLDALCNTHNELMIAAASLSWPRDTASVLKCFQSLAMLRISAEMPALLAAIDGPANDDDLFLPVHVLRSRLPLLDEMSDGARRQWLKRFREARSLDDFEQVPEASGRKPQFRYRYGAILEAFSPVTLT